MLGKLFGLAGCRSHSRGFGFLIKFSKAYEHRQVKVLAAMPDGVSSIPRLEGRAGTHSLSFAHVCTMPHVCESTYSPINKFPHEKTGGENQGDGQHVEDNRVSRYPADPRHSYSAALEGSRQVLQGS